MGEIYLRVEEMRHPDQKVTDVRVEVWDLRQARDWWFPDFIPDGTRVVMAVGRNIRGYLVGAAPMTEVVAHPSDEELASFLPEARKIFGFEE